MLCSSTKTFNHYREFLVPRRRRCSPQVQLPAKRFYRVRELSKESGNYNNLCGKVSNHCFVIRVSPPPPGRPTTIILHTLWLSTPHTPVQRPTIRY